MQTDQLPKLELDGFQPFNQNTPPDTGWRKRAAQIASKAGLRIEWKKQKPDDDIDIGYKRLLVKTGICAAVAIAILVISAVSPPIAQKNQTAGNAVSKEFDIPDDIGKLKFVEKLDDEGQSVMSVLPDSMAVIPSDGEVITTFGQAGAKGVRFSPDGQTAYCIARATVTAVGEVDGQGYVRLTLDTGETALYCNVDPAVQVDDIVSPGQVVGAVSGDYLYVEMKDGKEYVDPLAYITEHTATAQ
jgi:hypothetical protein